jgi:hypothetical protein
VVNALDLLYLLEPTLIAWLKRRVFCATGCRSRTAWYLIDRAAVIIGHGALGLVQDQVAVLMVHGAAADKFPVEEFPS